MAKFDQCEAAPCEHVENGLGLIAIGRACGVTGERNVAGRLRQRPVQTLQVLVRPPAAGSVCGPGSLAG